MSLATSSVEGLLLDRHELLARGLEGVALEDHQQVGLALLEGLLDKSGGLFRRGVGIVEPRVSTLPRYGVAATLTPNITTQMAITSQRKR